MEKWTPRKEQGANAGEEDGHQEGAKNGHIPHPEMRSYVPFLAAPLFAFLSIEMKHFIKRIINCLHPCTCGYSSHVISKTGHFQREVNEVHSFLCVCVYV